MRFRRSRNRTEAQSRLDTLPRRIALAAIPCLPALLLWRPLFGGESFFWGAPLLQFVPWLQQAGTMMLGGSVPLWNPLAGCGAPLAANYQTGAFYPPNVLHLLLPADLALTWVTAFHIILAGLAMYAWCRSIRLRWFSALIGALALEGSGYLVARAGLFPSVALAFAWIPAWLWRTEVLSQRVSLRGALWLALAVGLGLLSGHAQTAAYGGLLVAGYAGFRAVRMDDRGRAMRFLALATLAALLGVALAAIQLLPTAELLAQSHRSAGVDYDFAMTYSLWPWRMITFVAPGFFGTPAQGDFWGYATYWEDAGYVGLLPLLLAIEAVLAAGGERKGECRHLVWFLAACGLVGLLLALGSNTPLFPLLFKYVPGFDLFQAPARWLAVTTVALAALAALGAEQWPRGRNGQRRGALAVTLGLALLVAGFGAPYVSASMPETFAPATARLGVVLAVVGLLALLRRGSGWWRVAAVACVAADLLLSAAGLVPSVDRALYEGRTWTAGLLEAEGGEVRVYWPSDPEHVDRAFDAEYRAKFSYLTFDDFGPKDATYWRQLREAELPNAGMLDGVSSANNFDPLLVGRYAELLQAAVDSPAVLRVMGVTHVATDRTWENGTGLDGESGVNLYRLAEALGRAWIVGCGRQVDDHDALRLLADPSFNPATEVLLDVPADCRQAPASDSYGEVLSLQDEPNGITIGVALDGAGYLVLADTWYPGWYVTVDGESRPLLRANYSFRAVWLTEGQHSVKMVYRPSSFLTGARVSLAALALFVVGLASVAWRARKRGAQAGSGIESAGGR